MPDETFATLHTHLLNTALFPLNSGEVRVDNAPGFVGLQNDLIPQQYGLSLDFGRVENKNKIAVVEKAIQEFEQELLKVERGAKQITATDLLSILATLNQIIRFQVTQRGRCFSSVNKIQVSNYTSHIRLTL